VRLVEVATVGEDVVAVAPGVLKGVGQNGHRTEVARVLGKQVLRSGTSVGANYREAYRARSGPEFVSKVGDCLKELEETAYWLELLVDSGTVSSKKMAGLLQETSELLAIFTTISKKTKARLS
jgi:four helix bundle protein